MPIDELRDAHPGRCHHRIGRHDVTYPDAAERVADLRLPLLGGGRTDQEPSDQGQPQGPDRTGQELPHAGEDQKEAEQTAGPRRRHRGPPPVAAPLPQRGP
jgi:hypothetical protein